MAGDQYWSNVVLAVQGDGANAATTVHNKVTGTAATVGGNAQLSTAAKVYGASSLVFDGAGDYFSFPDSESWNLGAGDFTIECWYRPSTLTGASQWRGLVGQRNNNASNGSWVLFVNQNNTGFGFNYNVSGTSGTDVLFGSPLTVGQWYHVAVSRVGATLYCAVDGVVETKTGTASAFYNSTAVLSLGRLDSSTSAGFLNGYLDDIRITKGIARYTSNFTPSAIEIGAITPLDPYYNNVRLLLNMEGNHFGTWFLDESSRGYFVAGAATIYLSGEISKTGNTSCRFASSSLEYLYVPDVPDGDLRPGTQDFCIEAWVYPTASTLHNPIFAKGNATDPGSIFFAVKSSTRNLVFDEGATNVVTTSTVIALNTWTHVAAVRSGTTLTLYINGVSSGSGTLATDLNDTNELRIGRGRGTSANYFNGYIDALRYTVGVPRYTAAFTPPNYVLPNFGYSNYSLSGTTDLTVFANFQLSGVIALTIADDIYPVTAGVNLTTFAKYAVAGSVELDVVDAVYHLDGQVFFNTFALYQVTGGTSVDIIEPVLLAGGINLSMYGNGWALAGQVALSVYGTLELSGTASVSVVHPHYTLVAHTLINIHDTFLLTGRIHLSIYPGFTDGVGGQAQGEKVALPTNRRVDWTVRIMLGGADVSSRLTGTISVDDEESSAAVAVFKLRPGEGLVDVYSWTNNPVEVYQKDRTSNAEFLLFRGVADTPVFDASAGLVEFTCTDNQQKVINAMGRTAIDTLTPKAKWSKYVFDELAPIQQYLDDRCSTYSYAYGVTLNGDLEVYDYSTAQIKWEFSENMIVQGSLAPTLANVSSLVNYIEVKTSVQSEQFRETVISMRWKDQQFVEEIYFPYWWLCQAQMIMDAVNGTDASFVVDPLVGIIPPTSYRGKGGSRWAHVNPGDGLIAMEFMGSFSKRYLQNSQISKTVIVSDPSSVSQSGVRESTTETSISVTYNEGVTEAFTTPKDKQKYLCSAGSGRFQAPSDAIQPQPQDPLSIGAGGGWAPYPRLPISYSAWDETDTQLEDIHQYRWRMMGDGRLTQEHVLFGESGNVTAGEYLYLMDDFIIEGNAAEQDLAHETAVAVAKMQIQKAHRQNQVSFTTLIFPHIRRGDRVRVSTNRVRATGVVRQFTHLFDVDRGTALTNIYLAVSSSKAIGLGTGTFSNVKLSGKVSLGIVGPGTATQLPVNQADVDYNPSLLTYYTGNALETYTFDGEHWGGFFTKSSASGDLEFAIEFPAIAEDNVSNIDLLDYQGTVDAEVPNDELILLL